MRRLPAGLVLASCASVADWKAQPDIPSRLYCRAAAVLNGETHLLGGCHTGAWRNPSASGQAYDSVRGRWERKAQLPAAVAWSLSALWNGNISLRGNVRCQAGPGIESASETRVCGPLSDRPRQVHGLTQSLGTPALPTWTLDTKKAK